MVEDIRILSPCGMLGYGFPIESFMNGIKENPHGIIVDAGSTDAGPHKLGAGVSIVSRGAAKKDLEVIITNGTFNKIPIIIGSAGGAGAKKHVDWTLDIIDQLCQEHTISAKVAVIWGDIPNDRVMMANDLGKVTP